MGVEHIALTLFPFAAAFAVGGGAASLDMATRLKLGQFGIALLAVIGAGLGLSVLAPHEVEVGSHTLALPIFAAVPGLVAGYWLLAR